MTIPDNAGADATSEVLQIEYEIMTAIRNKDAATLEPLLADDFIYRTHFGAEANKVEFLKSVAAFPVEIVSITGDEVKANVYGETAIITGVQRAEARLPEGGVEESFVAFTDVFVRRDERWLMVLAYGVELPSETEEPLQM